MWEELMGMGLRGGAHGRGSYMYSIVPNVRRVESGHKTRAHVEVCGRGQDREPRYIRFCE